MPKLKPTLNAADMKLIYDVFKEMMDKRDEKLSKSIMEKTEQLFAKKIDPVLGELKAMREEVTVLAFHSAEHHDRLEKLEDLHPGYTHI